MSHGDNFIGTITGAADEFGIDCNTCIGVGTTACNECVVGFVLANDDGPIDFVPVPRIPDDYEVAISLFKRAGLVDSNVEFVPVEVFESATDVADLSAARS